MPEFPNFLESGELARLIPVVSEGSKENRAASILLSTMMAVDQLSRTLLATVGQRLGSRARVSCYTEVVPTQRPEGNRLRPDGLIVVAVGNRMWSAFIEAKIGRAPLKEDQIRDYLELARLNNVDAVITISNQFAALPTHHPINLPKRDLRRVELFHWSWMSVVTHATLLAIDDEFESDTQRYVLSEMIRYFRHDSVGVFGFDRMNPEWKDLALKVRSGAALGRTSPEVTNSTAAWHQETRDLSLIMSRLLGRNVVLKLPGKHKNDPSLRLQDDRDILVKSSRLNCSLEIPDAAAPLDITVDIGRRIISCSMRLEAPQDRQRGHSRINWLLRQLSSTDPQDIHVTAVWPSRAQNTQCPLTDARENPELLSAANPSLKPQAFEVQLVRDLAGKMSGAKTFIESIEQAVPDFYEQVGQHLKAWVPPAPKIIEKHEREIEAPQAPKGQTASRAEPNEVGSLRHHQPEPPKPEPEPQRRRWPWL